MASIASINKGTAIQYVTDKMGAVQFKAIIHKTGSKECFVMRDDEGDWKPYGIENLETIISLAKYQLQ